MLKKFIIYFFSILFLINIGYSLNYNSSYTNITIDAEGWCSNIETTIKIYNQTDYQNKQKINDNICQENQTPENDNCFIFNKIQADIIIYNGPMDGLKELLSTKIDNDNNNIKYKFNSANNYLVRIIPTTKGYNDAEDLVYIKDCKIKPVVKKEIKLKIYNKSFEYKNSNIILNLKNTNINSTTNITVEDIKKFNSSLTKLNSSIKTFQIKSNLNQTNFTNLDIQINLNFNMTSTIYVYKFEKSWKKISKFKKETNKITITNSDFGIYSIQEIKQEPKSVVKPRPKLVQTQINKPQKIKNESPNKSITLYLTIFIILILGITTFYYINKPSKKENKYKNDLTLEQTKENDKIKINTYSSAYKTTKEYTKKYKNDYSKDQIYRALKQAGTPTDIIDKVFIEEF